MSVAGAIRVVAAALLVPALVSARGASNAPLGLRAVALAQEGDTLQATVTTTGPPSQWLRDVHARLCLDLHTSRHAARVCLGGRRGTRLDVLGAAGRVVAVRPLPAVISTPAANTVRIGFGLDAVGLASGRLGWSANSRWSGAPCSPAQPCISRLPRSGARSAELKDPGPIGCFAAGAELRFSGPPTTTDVALTFDDGPSLWTPQVLHVLEQEHVPATFFVLGRNIAGREPLLLQMLRDGDAIGDHSYSHPLMTRGGPAAQQQITTTSALIDGATGYSPCLFRAPYGAVSPALLTEAQGDRMLTVGWNVDPRDWSEPGVKKIVATVLAQMHPGSIILFHDGGGRRAQTVAALPQIIAAVRARGLRPVTVPQLLGLRERRLLSDQSAAAAPH